MTRIQRQGDLAKKTWNTFLHSSNGEEFYKQMVEKIQNKDSSAKAVYQCYLTEKGYVNTIDFCRLTADSRGLLNQVRCEIDPTVVSTSNFSTDLSFLFDIPNL